MNPAPFSFPRREPSLLPFRAISNPTTQQTQQPDNHSQDMSAASTRYIEIKDRPNLGVIKSTISQDRTKITGRELLAALERRAANSSPKPLKGGRYEAGIGKLDKV
jgi:hypothetical protein